MNHATRLRRYMAERRMNQNELAAKLHVAKHQVSRWLNGTHPRHDKLKMISKRTGIPLVELL